MVSNMLLRGTLSQMSCYRVLSALQRHSLQLAASGSPPTTTSLPGDSVETDNMIVQQCEGEDEDEAGRWRSSSRNYRKPSTTVLNHGQCLAEAAANAPGCHQRGSGSLLTSPPPRANSCRAAECKAVAGSRQPLATVAGENNNVRRGLLGALEGNEKGFSFVRDGRMTDVDTFTVRVAEPEPFQIGAAPAPPVDEIAKFVICLIEIIIFIFL